MDGRTEPCRGETSVSHSTFCAEARRTTHFTCHLLVTVTCPPTSRWPQSSLICSLAGPQISHVASLSLSLSLSLSSPLSPSSPFTVHRSFALSPSPSRARQEPIRSLDGKTRQAARPDTPTDSDIRTVHNKRQFPQCFVTVTRCCVAVGSRWCVGRHRTVRSFVSSFVRCVSGRWSRCTLAYLRATPRGGHSNAMQWRPVVAFQSVVRRDDAARGRSAQVFGDGCTLHFAALRCTSLHCRPDLLVARCTSNYTAKRRRVAGFRRGRSAFTPTSARQPVRSLSRRSFLRQRQTESVNV